LSSPGRRPSVAGMRADSRETAGGGAISVTELTRRVRAQLEEAFPEFWVRGEISNLRIQSSGHAYFTLKDEGAQLPAVMFRTDVLRSGGAVRDGAKVSAYGRLSVYEPRGAYQMVVRALVDDGLGRLRAEFEQLKARLAAEGLFDAAKKRPLPRLPRIVGIVTSPTGAAVHDFISVLRRRGWKGRMILFPAKVQGDGAAREIAARIADAAETGLLDTLVVGRGGGSLEDLWPFNEEIVARAVATSPVPVISAVGHETDFTLCDFAADRRAETPTAAAELISSLRIEATDAVAGAEDRLTAWVDDTLAERGQTLDYLETRLASRSPRTRIAHERLRADMLEAALSSAVARARDAAGRSLDRHARALAVYTPHERLRRASDKIEATRRSLAREATHRLASARDRLDGLEARLRAAGVDATLNRGFAIVVGNDGVITSAAAVKDGTPLVLRFADGEAQAEGGRVFRLE